MDEVIEAIEMVFAQRPTPPRPPKATLRDLLDLDASYDIREEDTELGAVLTRLDANTMGNLKHFLEEHREEAIDRQYCSGYHYTYLCSVFGMGATYTSVPPDKLRLPRKPDISSDEVIRTRRGYVVNLTELNNALPFEATHTGSGGSKNLKTPLLAAILADALRESHPRITERAIEDTIEEVLGVSRSKQKRWRKRMEEVGRAGHSLTVDQLAYVALGKTRGPKPQS